MGSSSQHRRRTARTSPRLAAVLLAVAVLAAACSGDGDSSSPDSSTSSTSTSSTSTTTSEPTSTTATTDTTSPTADEEAVILERYLEFWDVRFEANSDPVDPADPRLADLATDAQLTNVLEETQRRADQGLALRNPTDSVTERRPVVVSVDGSEATIQDCSINDTIVYRVSDGEVIDDSTVTRSVSATMRKVDGVWKLSSTSEIQKWEGVAGCALSES